jgi:hypothetical protein
MSRKSHDPKQVAPESHALVDERIAELAYQKWVERGQPISDGTEDWFAARAELEHEELAETAGAGSSTK